MPENSEQPSSFDFSNPFTNKTVIVEAVEKTSSEDIETDIQHRFEQAKQTVRSNAEVNLPITDAISEKNHHKIGIHQWLMTFLLLVGLCTVSTYAFITYKQNEVLLADSQRQVEVVAVGPPELNRIVGKTFTIELTSVLPLDFQIENNSDITQSILARNNGKKSGLVVTSYENAIQKTDAELASILSKTFGDKSYQPNLVVINKYKVAKPMESGVLPSVYFTQTQTMFYQLELYNTITNFDNIPEKLLRSEERRVGKEC